MHFNSNTLLHILFELTLFVIFIYYLVKVITLYLLPTIEKQIREFKKKLEALIKRKDFFISQRKQIENKINLQKNRLESLEEKMKQWHTALCKNQENLASEQVAINDKIKEKKKKQANILTITSMQKKVIPHVVAQASLKLAQKYAGKPGKPLLSTLINNMAKS
jgi:chromosome segregation ATPase